MEKSHDYASDGFIKYGVTILVVTAVVVLAAISSQPTHLQ
jgi:hypothetical protein